MFSVTKIFLYLCFKLSINCHVETWGAEISIQNIPRTICILRTFSIICHSKKNYRLHNVSDVDPTFNLTKPKNCWKWKIWRKLVKLAQTPMCEYGGGKEKCCPHNVSDENRKTMLKLRKPKLPNMKLADWYAKRWHRF